MTWFVKSQGPDGKITSTLKDDWKEALELREKFQVKRIKAWIEDMDGRLVGFEKTKDAPVKG
jgi:hypothetical protein